MHVNLLHRTRSRRQIAPRRHPHGPYSMRIARIAVELRTRTHPGSPVPTVEVGGEIDVESGPDLCDRLLSIMHTRGPGLALDITGMTFIDCPGMSALLAARRPRPGRRRMAASDRGIPVRAPGHRDHGIAGCAGDAPQVPVRGDSEAGGITGHGKRGPAVRPIARTPHDPEPSGQLADRALWQGAASKARCADGALDPEEWFPASLHEERARREAARAIAVCMSCPVRAEYLELSLRHWGIGQRGIRGGLVAAERAALRRQRLRRARVRGPALPISPPAPHGPSAA